MTNSQNQPAPVKFSVQRGDQLVELTYQQVFTAGHKLWLAERYAEATQVFKRLSAVSDRGPRAHILLAHCQAMSSNYAGCLSTLAEVLGGDQFGNAASDLHCAFVMWKCTLYVDAKEELEKIVSQHPELPTPCLLLAELLMHAGNRQHPVRLLRQAIERDRPDGAIAAIARNELPMALKMAATPSKKPPVSRNQLDRKHPHV